MQKMFKAVKEDKPLQLALVFFVLYLVLLHVLMVPEQTWAYDYLGGFRLLSHDDSYRYYYSWSEWLNFESYKWNYILPVPMVLDGMMASMSSGNQAFMRSMHIAASAMTLWALGKSLLILGVHRKLVIASLVLLGAMPLYALVSMSFLGESWLLPALALVVYFYLRNLLLPMTLVASLLPLIRPEGIFALFSISLWLLVKRQYWLFILSGLPGFAYLLYLVWLFEPLGEMEAWRHNFVEYYQNFPKREALRRYLGYLDTFNPVFFLGSALALVNPAWRKHWPLWVGAFLWLMYISFAIATSTTNYEPRYVIVTLPVLVLGWGVFCQHLCTRMTCLQGVRERQGRMFLTVLTLLISAEHALQLDWLRKDTTGQRLPWDSGVKIMPDTGWKAPDSYTRDRHAVAEQIVLRLRQDADIDTVLVARDDVFYALSPGRIPAGVRVLIAPFDGRIVLASLDGVFFAYGPGEWLYGYFELYKGGLENRKKLLYVGNLYCRICRPDYENGNYQFHEFHYMEHQKMPRI